MNTYIWVLLTLPIPRLLSSKAQDHAQIFDNHLNPVGIHCIALVEYSQISTHVPGFQSYFRFFLHHFVLAILATSSIRVKIWC